MAPSSVCAENVPSVPSEDASSFSDEEQPLTSTVNASSTAASHFLSVRCFKETTFLHNMSQEQSPACDKHTTDAQPLAIEILIKPARHGIKKKKSDIRTKSAFVCQTLWDDALFFDD